MSVSIFIRIRQQVTETTGVNLGSEEIYWLSHMKTPAATVAAKLTCAGDEHQNQSLLLSCSNWLLSQKFFSVVGKVSQLLVIQKPQSLSFFSSLLSWTLITNGLQECWLASCHLLGRLRSEGSGVPQWAWRLRDVPPLEPKHRKHNVINDHTRAPGDKERGGSSKDGMLGIQDYRKWPLLKHLISPTLKPTTVCSYHKTITFIKTEIDCRPKLRH